LLGECANLGPGRSASEVGVFTEREDKADFQGSSWLVCE
jgi:hypothetical protein